MKYYKSSFYKDAKREFSKRHGWLVGAFMQSQRKTNTLEIKFWSFKKGKQTGHSRKYQKKQTEYNFVIKGKVIGEVEGKKVVLQAGDYIIVPPRIKNNLAVKVLSDAEGFCIKVPSLGKSDTVKLP